MSTEALSPAVVAAPSAPRDVAGRRSGRTRFPGVLTMLGSGLSTQVGAAVGSLAFPVIGPVGVVAVRQYVAALVLMAVGRPRLRSFGWPQWWPVLSLAAVFATMNLSLYVAIDRVGLGLAVTLEFLGPLGVALAGARRRLDLCCALLAAAGAVVLMRPQPSADYLGMGLALLAAGCWACYILLNRTVGRRLPGAEGSAAAAALSGLLFLPVGVVLVLRHPPGLQAVGYAVVAGLLCSAVPYLADLVTLRRVPARVFGLVHERQPGVRRAGRLDRPAPAALLAGMEQRRRDRRRQHAQHERDPAGRRWQAQAGSQVTH